MKKENPFHYTQCGLDNVYLANGYETIETPRGKTIRIVNVPDLHRAIGSDLVDLQRPLSGNELRFLRTELGLPQAALAAALGVDAQTVARWEKEETDPPRTTDAAIRQMYSERIGENEAFSAILRRIADLDDLLDDLQRRIEVRNEQDGTWHTKHAA
jgi:DNA-binding transcriptional regulator YiaG